MVAHADVPSLVLALLSSSLVLLPASPVLARARLRGLSGPARCPGLRPDPASRTNLRSTGRAGSAGSRRALLFAALAATSVLVTLRSAGGAVTALAVLVGTYLLLRAGGSSDSGASRLVTRLAALPWAAGSAHRVVADPRLPFAVDLLSVCLRAGMPTSSALRSVATILSDPAHVEEGPTRQSADNGVSFVLAQVAAASELGSEPTAAWQEWIAHPIYGPLARALVVTGESGSAVASRLEAVSRQLRTVARQQAMTRAQRAGVALMAPLGLCFLPAFVCLGVVPVIVGIAGQVFG